LSLAREWTQLARQIHDSADQRSGTADLLRIEAQLAQLDRDFELSEKLYRQALSVSAAQSVRLPALRAATRLAGLLVHRNRARDARSVLAPIYAWFTEGFDTPPLKDAKALIDELA
jgi:predicted ATPase